MPNAMSKEKEAPKKPDPAIIKQLDDKKQLQVKTKQTVRK